MSYREKIERWRQNYNDFKPHSSLGDLTPCEFRLAHLHIREWTTISCLCRPTTLLELQACDETHRPNSDARKLPFGLGTGVIPSDHPPMDHRRFPHHYMNKKKMRQGPSLNIDHRD
ncbi:integrase core domain-containing protein [Pandoraea sp. PE-S2R-1]|uniref:integrase core domain-containing protein n=1 Tax=Pandoraea sp. PE-S2R-1 TaxID=1986994 RepID=UPI000B3FF71E